MKQVQGLILCSMLLAIVAISVPDTSLAENITTSPVNVTILNIHVKELSTGTNFGPNQYHFYMIWVNDNPVTVKPPLFYPMGVTDLDDYYNITINTNEVQIRIGAWWIGQNNLIQLDLSSFIGEAENYFPPSTFVTFPTFRSNTFIATYNTSSQTLSGDSTSIVGNYYYTNGSTDGTGLYHAGIKFALSTFNQTIPGTDVNVNLNMTIENNITLNETPPQVNISVPVPDVFVDVNVSPPNVSAPNVNITQPLIINQSLEGLSIPPAIVNINYTPPPLVLNISSPVVNMTYSPNETSKTPIVKTSISSEVQIPSVIYITILLLSIGTIIVGCIAIGLYSNMKRMMSIMEASLKTPEEKKEVTK